MTPSKVYAVGDEVDVPKTVEFATYPDGTVVTVRPGGTHRLDVPGEHKLGRRTYKVESPED